MTETTLRKNDSAGEQALYMAMELSAKRWRLLFSAGGRHRGATVDAGDLSGLSEALGRARRRLGVAPQAPVYSCYEAGRDGFWLHRHLTGLGVSNVVVDSASVEQPRRRRRAKTDRIDVEQLLRRLVNYVAGEREVWKVVRVPSEEEEDARRLHRERERLVKERTAHRTRLKSLLALEGVRLEAKGDFVGWLREVRRHDGGELGADLVGELEREHERLVLVQRQLRVLQAEQRARLVEPDSEALRQVVQLMRLAGIGRTSAWVFVMEFFAWRRFRNRREVGALAGMTGTPYDSGQSRREQGVSKAGNRRVRALAIEIAWFWLRHQPDSALSQWYRERFAGAGPRARRVGIVALARKLLVALWRYLQFGELPAGARMSAC